MNQWDAPLSRVDTNVPKRAGNRLGQQGVLTAVGKVRQPAEDVAHVDAVGRRYGIHVPTVTDGLDRLLSPHRQRGSAMLAVVGCSLVSNLNILSCL